MQLCHATRLHLSSLYRGHHHHHHLCCILTTITRHSHHPCTRRKSTLAFDFPGIPVTKRLQLVVTSVILLMEQVTLSSSLYPPVKTVLLSPSLRQITTHRQTPTVKLASAAVSRLSLREDTSMLACTRGTTLPTTHRYICC